MITFALAVALVALAVAAALITGHRAAAPARTICADYFPAAIVATKGANGAEPTHYCADCDAHLWVIFDGASVWCPRCDSEATEATCPVYM
ncbi:hypothetical protein [Planomonospora algeriensis]